MKVSTNQDWVVWGKTKNGDTFHQVINCKAPNRTKYYRSIQKRFGTDWDLQKFGYMTLKEFNIQKGWIDYDTLIKL